MSELRDLYQEVILDHNRRPRNFRVLEPCTHEAVGHNPLCGDQVRVFLRCSEGRVQKLAFQGEACAICTASASIMTEALEGESLQEAEGVFRRFQELLTQEQADASEGALGKLEVLAGVRAFPSRIKCAMLPWHTLRAALQGEAAVSTEQEEAS